ncbi:MAG: hypothetical protein KA436_01225 [Oligoflexales bacterium]|nr:hypothetical protein [Oligoflexales bacterium]
MRFFLSRISFLFVFLLAQPSLAEIEKLENSDSSVFSFRYRDELMLPTQVISMMKDIRDKKEELFFEPEGGTIYKASFVKTLGSGVQGRADLVDLRIDKPDTAQVKLSVVVKQNHGQNSPKYILGRINEVMNQGGEFEFMIRNYMHLPEIAHRIYGVDRGSRLLVMEPLRVLDLKKLPADEIAAVFKGLGEWLTAMEERNLSSSDIKVSNIGYSQSGWRPFDLGVNADNDHTAYGPSHAPGAGQWDAFLASRLLGLPDHEAAMRTGRRQMAWVLGQVLFLQELKDQTFLDGRRVAGVTGLVREALTHVFYTMGFIAVDESYAYEARLRLVLSVLVEPKGDLFTYGEILSAAPHLQGMKELPDLARYLLNLLDKNVPAPELFDDLDDL